MSGRSRYHMADHFGASQHGGHATCPPSARSAYDVDSHGTGSGMTEGVRSIYQGRVLHLTLEDVELPNGARAQLEIAHHPGGAAIVALDSANRVCLLRQYRHAAGGWVTELPAGKIDNREPPLECAQRELAEEAAVQAGRWDSLGDFLS